MAFRNLVSCSLSGALILAFSALLGGEAAAENGVVSPMAAGDRSGCRSVHAVLQEREIVECPADQAFEFCFTRQVVDQAGWLTGRMEFFSDPSKEAKLQHAPGRIVYHGVTKLVTTSGVLRAEEIGVFDTKTKDWSGLSEISGGTGDFKGATGNLASFGNAKGIGLEIGTICQQ